MVEETREHVEVEAYFMVEWDDPRLSLPEKASLPGRLGKPKNHNLWTSAIETANMTANGKLTRIASRVRS